MTQVLVVLSSPEGVLKKNHQELLTLGRSQGQVAVALLDGPGLAEDASRYGASKVFTPAVPLAGASAAAAFVAEAVAASDAGLVLVENSVAAKELAAVLGVKLDAGVVTDVVAVDDSGAARKSVLAGAYTTVARARSQVAVYTVKANAVEPSEDPHAATVTELSFTVDPATAVTLISREAKAKSGRPELSEASIVVSGGRGLDGDFGPVEALADALGAAVGASRAATDAGWIGHEAQVGQTGVTVAPALYVSVGISGAVQQKAGMQTSQLIVAINNDPDAPVFEIADFGVVGDLFTVLPQLTEEIQRRKG